MPKKDSFGDIVKVLAGVHHSRLGLFARLAEKFKDKEEGARLSRIITKLLKEKPILALVGQVNVPLGVVRDTIDCFVDEEMFGTDRDSRIDTFLPSKSEERKGKVSAQKLFRASKLPRALQDCFEMPEEDLQEIKLELVLGKHTFSPAEVDRFVRIVKPHRACKPSTVQHNYFFVEGKQGEVFVLCVRWIIGKCRVSVCPFDNSFEVPEKSLLFFRHPQT